MASINESFFIRRNGRVLGPFARAHLAEKIRSGRISEDVEISVDRKEWLSIDDFDIMAEPAATTVPEGTDVPVAKLKLVGRDDSQNVPVAAFSSAAPTTSLRQYPGTRSDLPNSPIFNGAPGNIFCTSCGNQIHPKAQICPGCGVPTYASRPARNNEQASVITVFLAYVLCVIAPFFGLIGGIYLVAKQRVVNGAICIILSLALFFVYLMFLVEGGVFSNFRASRERARTTTCIANLKQIHGAKQQWAIQENMDEDAIPTKEDLDDYFSDGIESIVCPLGTSFDDSYGIGDVGNLPWCKQNPIHHSLPEY